MLLAARSMSLTGYDVLTNEALRKEVRQAFENLDDLN